MKKILVAIDGSESCNKAANKAKELAILCKSNITFINIVIPKFKVIGSKEEFEGYEKNIEENKQEIDEVIKECDKIYKECKSSIKDSNIKTEKVIKEGRNPAAEICEFAENNNFDLIVIADKGRGNIKKFLLGSTTEKVVRYASTSVLVVK